MTDSIKSSFMEYFFGSETKKFYWSERVFYREHFLENEELEKFISRSKKDESLEVFAGRHVPNILSAISVGAMIYCENLVYMLPFIASEFLRVGVSQRTSYRKNSIKNLIYRCKEFNIKTGMIEDEFGE